MNNNSKLRLENKILRSIKKSYDSKYMPRTIDEICEIVRYDPVLFERCLKRAKSYMNNNSEKRVKNISVWIACNLAESLRKNSICYFCDRKLTRKDFLNGEVHLEHFDPRSNKGVNEPGNITLACKQCNLLKSNLTDEDFIQILTAPDDFFFNKGYNKIRVEQLRDFAEIYYPRIEGLSGYAKRHDISSNNIRIHWDGLRQRYREKWQRT